MEGTLHITDSDGNLNVFNVEHNHKGLWLNSNNGHPDNVWNADNRWVFVRRNSLYFSPKLLGEFCLSRRSFKRRRILLIVHSNRLTFCQSHQAVQIMHHIFYYPNLWFPIVP